MHLLLTKCTAMLESLSGVSRMIEIIMLVYVNMFMYWFMEAFEVIEWNQ